jgi:hypothetical protein
MSEVPLESTTSVVRRKEILSAEVDNEVVLMSVEQGVYYGLNPVGALVWSVLREPVRVQDLCEKVVEEFDVTLEQCQPDVLELLDDLRAQHLIQIVEPGSSSDP